MKNTTIKVMRVEGEIEFRAVYEDEVDGITSIPLEDATEPYNIIGLYRNYKEEETGHILQEHIVDIPAKQFKKLIKGLTDL